MGAEHGATGSLSAGRATRARCVDRASQGLRDNGGAQRFEAAQPAGGENVERVRQRPVGCACGWSGVLAGLLREGLCPSCHRSRRLSDSVEKAREEQAARRAEREARSA